MSLFWGETGHEPKIHAKHRDFCDRKKSYGAPHRPVPHVNKSLANFFPIHFVHFSLIVTKISKLPELRFVLVISNLLQNFFWLILTKKAHLPQFRISWRFLLEWWFTVLANLQKQIFVLANLQNQRPVRNENSIKNTATFMTGRKLWDKQHQCYQNTWYEGVQVSEPLRKDTIFDLQIYRTLIRMLGDLRKLKHKNKDAYKNHWCPSSQTPPISEPKTPQNSTAPLNRFSI